MKKKTDIVIYQARSGKIEFKGDFKQDTILASQKQIAQLYDVNVRTINEHLKNIYKTEELHENSTIRKFRIVQKEGKRNIEREINFYNLDAILSVGYRINSKKATLFRIWAKKTLKQHLIEGYTLNKNRIAKNYDNFLRAVSGVKAVLPKNSELQTEELLGIINTFAGTWLSLDAYDTESFPQEGAAKKHSRRYCRQYIPVIWRGRSLFHRGRKSGPFAVFYGKKSSFHRRQQEKRRLCLCLVPQKGRRSENVHNAGSLNSVNSFNRRKQSIRKRQNDWLDFALVERVMIATKNPV